MTCYRASYVCMCIQHHAGRPKRFSLLCFTTRPLPIRGQQDERLISVALHVAVNGQGYGHHPSCLHLKRICTADVIGHRPTRHDLASNRGMVTAFRGQEHAIRDSIPTEVLARARESCPFSGSALPFHPPPRRLAERARKERWLAPSRNKNQVVCSGLEAKRGPLPRLSLTLSRTVDNKGDGSPPPNRLSHAVLSQPHGTDLPSPA